MKTNPATTPSRPSPSAVSLPEQPPRTNPVGGLHHVTAIATDAQANIDFYAGLLGLRLVKKTVNFDDPSAYHLYYGDESGTPGSIVTFFYWPGARRGQAGAGQTTAIVFSAPEHSLTFWSERLRRHDVPTERVHRFGEDVLAFSDPDGIRVELVSVPNDSRRGWSGAGISDEFALRGMHTLELTVAAAAPTADVLTALLGHSLVRQEGGRARYEAGPGGSGRYVDVVAAPHERRATGGAGTIHHLAFRVEGDAAQRDLRQQLTEAGLLVSDVRDRDYFRSIYFRERGGILFEVATDVPGFTVDEPLDSLGTALRIPKQFEPARAQIESLLPPLHGPREHA